MGAGLGHRNRRIPGCLSEAVNGPRWILLGLETTRAGFRNGEGVAYPESAEKTRKGVGHAVMAFVGAIGLGVCVLRRKHRPQGGPLYSRLMSKKLPVTTAPLPKMSLAG